MYRSNKSNQNNRSLIDQTPQRVWSISVRLAKLINRLVFENWSISDRWSIWSINQVGLSINIIWYGSFRITSHINPRPISSLELKFSGWYWCLGLIRDVIRKEPYNILYLSSIFPLHNRPFHDNCRAVIVACAQPLPDGHILITQNSNALRCLQVPKSAK
jgi:hypothetical protein